jgi:hypothetical protein
VGCCFLSLHHKVDLFHKDDFLYLYEDCHLFLWTRERDCVCERNNQNFLHKKQMRFWNQKKFKIELIINFQTFIFRFYSHNWRISVLIGWMLPSFFRGETSLLGDEVSTCSCSLLSIFHISLCWTKEVRHKINRNEDDAYHDHQDRTCVPNTIMIKKGV